MKMYSVSFKLTPSASLNKEVEAENEKEAKAKAKDYFVAVVGSSRVKDDYNNKNVVCLEIKQEPIIREDNQEV